MNQESRGLAGREIVCVGFSEWTADLWTNQQHLMSRLAASNRILFVESLGLRRPQLAGRDLRRIVKRLRTGLQGVQMRDGVAVLSPLVLPLHSHEAVRRLNGVILRQLVSRAMGGLGLEHPILWAYVPQAEALLGAVDPSLVVYHCVDDIAAQKGVDAEAFRRAEDGFAARADLVIASSRPLAERMEKLNPNVLYAPNVADTELFATALEPGPVDASLAGLEQPRLIFAGAITATKLDLDLLEGIARNRPAWQLALAGPVGAGDPGTDVGKLAALPNVHLLGTRRQEELPALFRGGSVGLIPYAHNRLTASIFPMKVYEYLAAGLPVVATSLPPLAGVEGIAFADDAEAAVEAIEVALASGTEAERQARSRLADGHSWTMRIDEIGNALDALDR